MWSCIILQTSLEWFIKGFFGKNAFSLSDGHELKLNVDESSWCFDPKLRKTFLYSSFPLYQNFYNKETWIKISHRYELLLVFYLWFKLILDYFEIYLQTQSIMHKLNLKWMFRFDVWGWRQPDAVLNLSILCVVCSYYSILLTKNISQFQTKCFWQLHLTITRICSEL